MSELDDSSNPFAPPLAQVEDPVLPTGALAGRGARFVAFLIDAIAIWLLMVGGGLVYGTTQLSNDAFANLFGMLTFQGTVVLAFVVLQCVLLYRRSQTLGKVAMNIRIVRGDGSRVGFGRVLGLRVLPMWLIGFIPLIGLFLWLIDSLMIFRDSRCCLHDDIADTIVVRV
jgi:uncharacterized RDD family membrane protein YckC